MEATSDGDRCREVVQPDQRLWVHSAARRRQGRFRPYFGGREGRSVDPQRGSAGPVRRGCKQGEDLGGEPQGEVNRMRGVVENRFSSRATSSMWGPGTGRW